MRSRRDRGVLLATAACAIGVPVTAAAWVSAQTAALAEHIGAAGGVTARIGGVDADLTGTIRLSDVALGDLVAADAIEASVALDSLLSGALRADEVRVAGPHVALQIDGDGDSDLARLARRLMSRARGPGAGDAGGADRAASAGDAATSRLRRIVVSSGTLSAHVAGLGELVAEGVELVPDAGGVRVITGAVRIDGRAGPLDVELRFARSAAELTLPHVRFGRVLAVGGTGAVDPTGEDPRPTGKAVGVPTPRDPTGEDPRPAGKAVGVPTPRDPTGEDPRPTPRDLASPIASPTGPAPTGTSELPGAPGSPGSPEARDRGARLRDVAVGRLAAGGTLELRATVDDGGIPRPLAIDVRPREQAIAVRGDRIPLRALAPLAARGLELDAAHATGSLAVRRDGARVVVEVDGALDGAALDHRVLAALPVPLAAQIHASLAISPDAIAVSRAAIELGAAHLAASGWSRRGTPASGQLELSLATAACSDLLAALPAELRGPLDGMALGGSFGGHVRIAVDLAAPPGDGVELSASITDGCRSEAEPPAADVARLAGSADQVFADGSHARIGKGEPGWAQLSQLPPHVAGAFVSAEDARFYEHAGFDLTQIARSLEIDLREHRLARGGSTISQQLVKNAFLSQRRSFDRKLQEAILTWRLEARLDKKQILERYLNIIELGPRVFGLTAAARYWFDAAPRELSVRQAAFLAALTSEPSSMSRRVRRAGGLDPDSAARVDVVLRAMRIAGALDAGQLAAARSAALRFAPAALKQER